VREICALRAMRRELETKPRRVLNGHAGGNPGYGQGSPYRATAPVPDPTKGFPRAMRRRSSVASCGTAGHPNFPASLAVIPFLGHTSSLCQRRIVSGMMMAEISCSALRPSTLPLMARWRRGGIGEQDASLTELFFEHLVLGEPYGQPGFPEAMHL